MLLKTQAATEIARFLAHHPTPEQIVAFHPSSEVAERAYELIRTEREGALTEEERQELESYVVIEYLMELIKLEAQRQLSWPRYCGVGKLGLYSSTEGDEQYAKGTTNVYKRVQVRSRALSEDQQQEYQPGGTRPGDWRQYAASLVPTTDGAG
jgi:hypothetical protein